MFTGRELDAETGLFYYRARYFSPDLGRFLSRDPLGFLTGDANLYRYVANTPCVLVDPHGLAPALVENVVGMALLGLWANRCVRTGTAGKLFNMVERAAWNWHGVPIPGLTYAVRTSPHVERIVDAMKESIRRRYAAQAVGEYAGEGSIPLLFAPEKTAMECIFSQSRLSFSYRVSVRLDANRNKCHQGTITWQFYDEIDANSFKETYEKGGFGKDVPIVTKAINSIEGLADIAFDEIVSANYEVRLKWTTDVALP